MALPEEPVPRVTTAAAFDPVQVSVRWAGVWTGFLIAIGVFMILTALGLAIGVTAANNTSTNTQAVASGAAWWGGISFLIALFIGGAVSARWVAGGVTSVLQGALVWVLAVMAVIGLASFGISLGAQWMFAQLSTHIANNPDMAQFTNGIASQVGTTGTTATPTAEPAAWITFIVLCLSAIAAMVGGLVGRHRAIRPLV
jgi:hypothetical protein